MSQGLRSRSSFNVFSFANQIIVILVIMVVRVKCGVNEKRNEEMNQEAII